MLIFKRILTILLFLVGVASVGFGTYVNHQVDQGKQKIQSAQKSVDQSKELFSSTPYTKDIGDELTGSFQKKIDEGQVMVQKYAALASWMQTGGFVAAALGLILFFITLRKKTKS